MQIKFWLSDGNTGIAVRDGHGLRITGSTYSWINPPAGMAYYLEEQCLQGGPIYIAVHCIDHMGKLTWAAQLRSGRSITRHERSN